MSFLKKAVSEKINSNPFLYDWQIQDELQISLSWQNNLHDLTPQHTKGVSININIKYYTIRKFTCNESSQRHLFQWDDTKCKYVIFIIIVHNFNFLYLFETSVFWSISFRSKVLDNFLGRILKMKKKNWTSTTKRLSLWTLNDSIQIIKRNFFRKFAPKFGKPRIFLSLSLKRL